MSSQAGRELPAQAGPCSPARNCLPVIDDEYYPLPGKSDWWKPKQQQRPPKTGSEEPENLPEGPAWQTGPNDWFRDDEPESESMRECQNLSYPVQERTVLFAEE
ncbi:hypothetical protein Y1Q_0011915 [Alligator mississippiensis]|uniref:Uncharacterized protein n=1 Tax=Alligator mississippiensis TaxID=8496 RepID=A0A151NCD2_ALLMI|nr:hypothetical protein Y1Q_0011915 [Alligator mississippiensis]